MLGGRYAAFRLRRKRGQRAGRGDNMNLKDIIDKLDEGLCAEDWHFVQSAMNDLEDFVDTINQPQFEVGQDVSAMNDICEWNPVKVTKIRATYQYAMEMPPERFFKGGEVPGVWWDEKKVKAILQKTPNTDFNLTQPAASQVKS